MINDVTSTVAGLFPNNTYKENVAQKVINDPVNRKIMDRLFSSGAFMGIGKLDIALAKEKNEVYAEARAEILSSRNLTNIEFFSLPINKFQESIITSIKEKFSELWAQRLNEKEVGVLESNSNAADNIFNKIF